MERISVFRICIICLMLSCVSSWLFDNAANLKQENTAADTEAEEIPLKATGKI